jgi:hypothetical protein
MSAGSKGAEMDKFRSLVGGIAAGAAAVPWC